MTPQPVPEEPVQALRDWPEAPAVASGNTAPATLWSQEFGRMRAGLAHPQDREDNQPGPARTTQANLTVTK